MLTGNTPPALIATHAYYEQHRWRRLIDDEQLQRHADMHSGAGPTTTHQWAEKHWPDGLPEPSATDRSLVSAGANGPPNRGRGSLGRALTADYPPVPCNRDIRRAFGPGGQAIPDQLRGEPGRWATVDLPDDLVSQLGQEQVDLTYPYDRRRALPLLLELGPAELVVTAVTFPQLRDEWPHLDLSDILRQGWEACYPALADDIPWGNPSA